MRAIIDVFGVGARSMSLYYKVELLLVRKPFPLDGGGGGGGTPEHRQSARSAR